jgi:hypothetical protein
MTAPNLKSPTQVTGKTFASPILSDVPVLLANPADSGQVWKINAIVVHSIDGATTTTLTLNLMRSASAATSLLYNKEITPGTTLEVINRNTSFYLEEGDSLESMVYDNFICDVMISYEIIGEPTPP